MIILWRDPLSRPYSHYQHAVRKLREKLSFEEALKPEKNCLEGEEEKINFKGKYYIYNHACFAYVKRSL